MCCHKGNENLMPIKVCEEFQHLVDQNDGYTKNYLQNISNLTMLWHLLQINSVNIPGICSYRFKLHGQVLHTGGSLQPLAAVAPTYAGLFILDFYTVFHHRIENEANTMLLRNNGYFANNV